MIHAARHLGTENLLVVPGAVYIPWLDDSEEVSYKLVDQRAREAGVVPGGLSDGRRGLAQRQQQSDLRI